ncbi:uncharacterized protein LOC144148664 [Haemaphysalis longicornis]
MLSSRAEPPLSNGRRADLFGWLELALCVTCSWTAPRRTPVSRLVSAANAVTTCCRGPGTSDDNKQWSLPADPVMASSHEQLPAKGRFYSPRTFRSSETGGGLSRAACLHVEHGP